jgi:hypothetical protein
MALCFENLGNKVEFHTGSSYNEGHSRSAYGIVRKQVYRKMNGKDAVCIKQIGYGNDRAVGSVFSFGPKKKVFIEGSSHGG